MARNKACALVLNFVIAATVGACAYGPTVGCALYADPEGDDRAAGTRDAPLRTPGRLVAALGPGETGCLRGGTYTAAPDGYVLAVRRSDVEVRSAPGERARLVGIVMVGNGASDVRLAHLDIIGTGGQNTVKVYGRDVALTDSYITNAGRGESCIILGSTSGGRAVRPVVERNQLHECGARADGNKDHGIYVARADGADIVDNVFRAPAAYAIQLYPDAQGAYVARNVIDGGGTATVRGGIVIGGDDEAASGANVVERNVIADTAAPPVEVYWESDRGEGNVVRRNCTWGTPGEADADGVEFSDNVVADPRFRDRERGDYRLDPAGPCVDVVGFTGHSSSLGR
jgi:hypothetical protein